MYWSEPLFAIGSRTMGERRFGLSACFPASPPDQIGLDRFEECLHGGIVIAITFAAHRHLEIVLAQDLLVVVRTVLAA